MKQASLTNLTLALLLLVSLHLDTTQANFFSDLVSKVNIKSSTIKRDKSRPLTDHEVLHKMKSKILTGNSSSSLPFEFILISTK